LFLSVLPSCARFGELQPQRDQPIGLASQAVDDDVQQLLDVGPAPAGRVDLGRRSAADMIGIGRQRAHVELDG
jgi:hypothetical protein